MGGAKLHAKVSLLATWGPKTVQQMSQGTLGFCPPPPTSPLSDLFMEKPVSDRALGGIVEWTSGFPLRGRSHSYFREDGWCVPPSQSHMSESVPEYFSDFGRAEPLVSSHGVRGGGGGRECSAGSQELLSALS